MLNSPKIARLQFSVVKKSIAASTATVYEKSILNCRGNLSLKFNAMGAARPPYNVTRYTQFPVKWRHDNMQNTWVTPRGPEIATARLEEARWNLSRRFYTSRAIQSTLRGAAGDAQCTMRTPCISFWWDGRKRKRQRGASTERDCDRERWITAGAAKRIIDASVLMASPAVYYERFSRCDANHRSESTPREKALRIYEPWIERPDTIEAFPMTAK